MSIQLKNIALAERMKLLGDLTTLDGGKTAMWKAKAYYKASEILVNLDIPADTVGDFKNFAGIGDSTADKISELISTGKCEKLEQLKAKYPGAEEALKLTCVSGVGIKRAIDLFNSGISSLELLSQACDAGMITNSQIINGVKLALNSRGRLPLNEVVPAITSILFALRNMPEVIRAEFAGSVRRGKETVKDVDIIVITNDQETVIKQFLTYGQEMIVGQHKARIMAPIDISTFVQVDLLFAKPESFGSALAYFTGSKEHNVALRTLANKRGLTFNEHGFYTLEGKLVGGTDESELYHLLNLPWCPPELREGDQLLDQIHDIITSEDINSDWHMHSVYSSDARDTIDDMVAEAKARGLKTIGFTDHTEVRYGWSTDSIEQRRVECQSAQDKYGIKVYAACEVGIRDDGTLDWSDDLLNKMDYVIASIHYNHGKENYTKRLVDAARHPLVNVLGHPTGAILGRRDEGQGDWDEVFKACKETGTILEINGARMDLPTSYIKQAKKQGCKFVLTSDAHAVNQLMWQDYAVTLARRAGLSKDDLLTPKEINDKSKITG